MIFNEYLKNHIFRQICFFAFVIVCRGDIFISDNLEISAISPGGLGGDERGAAGRSSAGGWAASDCGAGLAGDAGREC